MIGEIRDAETAQIAIRSAITGHLVLSTIHTNDAASSIVRLVDMGIEPYLVSSAVVVGRPAAGAQGLPKVQNLTGRNTPR
jgi:type II secretory ATPase GspE/PulE/Tfp pilus assembly ATPase PilB-like protein